MPESATIAPPPLDPLAADAPDGTSAQRPDGRRLLPNHVVLWRGEGRRVVAFGALAGLGVAVGLATVAAWLAGAGHSPAAVLPVLLGVLVPGIVVGSRAWALAVELRVRPLREALGRTGFAFQGGLLGVALGLPVAAWALGVHPFVLTDACALALPAAHAVGRLGCLSYGCCYGRPTAAPWAMRYTCPEAKAVWEAGFAGIPLHPAPLYQAAGCLAHAALLAALATSGAALGVVTGTYLVVAAGGRWCLEHLRHATTRPTPFQRFSAVQALVGVAVLACTDLATGGAAPGAWMPFAGPAGASAGPWAAGPAAWTDALAGGVWAWGVLGFVGVAVPLGVQGARPGVFR